MKKFLYNLLATVAEHIPVTIVCLRYLLRFKKLPNLRHPRNLNEKILYLKLFTDTSAWTKLADKYEVRKYVEACGLKDILIPLLGVWERVEDIPFDSLPKRFILKANNGDGKGTNIKIDKTQMSSQDWQALRTRLNGWLSTTHIGALSAEPQYRHIPPLILAEELLPAPEGQTSLVDYKLWCFNGQPYSFFVCSNRKSNGFQAEAGCYDLQWNHYPDNMLSTSHFTIPRTPLPRPQCLEEMLKVGRILSKPFPQVRVDLYECNGKVYFGELTFTSLGGMMNYYTPAYLQTMGAEIALPPKEK